MVIGGDAPQYEVQWDAVGRWERLQRFWVRANAEAYLAEASGRNEGVSFRIVIRREAQS